MSSVGLPRRHAPVLLAVLAVVAVRLPTLTDPLSPDEGGFLLVGGQWHAGGGSLYGAYWVDRPPLLLAIFALAHALGGPLALRLIGCVAAASVVALAGVLGHRYAGSRGAGWTAAVAAGLVAMPGFNSSQVSGELLAIPWVLGGVTAFLLAADQPTARRRTGLLALAGGCGAAAFLVKQSFVDVFVLVAVLVAARAVADRSWAGVRRDLPAFAAGAVVVAGLVLGLASTRGTSPAGLWEAVVSFRADASALIASSASSATSERLSRYPLVLLSTGAAAIVALFLVRVVRRPEPVTLAALALLAWESAAVLLGGSYWLHYLMGLVPGLVLATTLLLRDRGRLSFAVRTLAVYVVAFALVATVTEVTQPSSLSDPDVAGRWLADKVEVGDTAVVAYGAPNILQRAGVSSPYADLWSLPVRVRDPRLQRLTGVLVGPQAPDWLLVYHTLETWGIQPGRAERAVAQRYRQVAEVCGYRVYLRDGVQRRHGVGDLPERCVGLAAGARPGSPGS